GARDADPRPRAEVAAGRPRRLDRHPGLEVAETDVALPEVHLDRRRHRRLAERRRPLLADPAAAAGRLRLAAVRARARPKVPPALMRLLVEPAKVAVLVFVAGILQVTIFSSVDILGGTPDVVLLTLV